MAAPTHVVRMLPLRRTFLKVVWNPSVTQVCHHVNYKTTNPREPHYTRKRMLEVCKPIYVKDPRTDWEICEEFKFKQNDLNIHPYHVLLAKELMKEWNSSRMVFFYHYNILLKADQQKINIMFFRQKINLRFPSDWVAKVALMDTHYSSVLHLFQSKSTAVAFSKDIAIDRVLKLNKKTSNFYLLGGLLDNRLLSVAELKHYGALPSLVDLQSETSALLSNLAGGETSQILSHHQNALSRSLQQYITQNSESVEK